MKKKDTRLHIRASSEQMERLEKAAEILEVPAAELVRRAIEDKLSRLAKRYPELAKAA
jgi:predicted DNA-binding protein